MNLETLLLNPNEFISQTIGVECILVGNTDGAFWLLPTDCMTFEDSKKVQVLVSHFLELLKGAGLHPKGGSSFPYGGRAYIVGQYELDGVGELSLVELDSVEVTRPHREPIKWVAQHG